MKKRIVMSIMTIALVAALIGGSTLSWFTDTVTVNTFFHAGTVAISVNGSVSKPSNNGMVETCWPDPKPKPKPTDADVAKECWNPGDFTPYEIDIANIGSKSVSVRFKVIYEWGTKDCSGNFTADPTLPTDNVNVTLSDRDWKLNKNGFYYYNGALNGTYEKDESKGDGSSDKVTVTPIITLIGDKTGNKYQGKFLHISIKVDAVQARNFDKNSKWPDVDNNN